jgi:hypothetical protein
VRFQRTTADHENCLVIFPAVKVCGDVEAEMSKVLTTYSVSFNLLFSILPIAASN